jgi:hypothetical protein
LEQITRFGVISRKPPGTPMHLIDLIEKELQAYRETGRAIHLAHAARALDEARAVIGTQTAVGSFKVQELRFIDGTPT